MDRRKVEDLTALLNDDAANGLRSMLEEIMLVPKDGELEIELVGEIVGIVAGKLQRPRCLDRGLCKCWLRGKI
jgi:hypothetical protein